MKTDRRGFFGVLAAVVTASGARRAACSDEQILEIDAAGIVHDMGMQPLPGNIVYTATACVRTGLPSVQWRQLRPGDLRNPLIDQAIQPGADGG